jgi:hypothetical protein
MKEKVIFMGGIILATGIPIYNYYVLPGIRHKEMMDKVDSFDKRLKKIENEKNEKGIGSKASSL